MLLHWLWELRYCIDTLPMNDPFDLLQNTNSLTIIGDIKRNRDVNILLQAGFTSKKTNQKCLPLTNYTENTGPEMIFSRFKKNRKIWNRQKSELRLCRTRHQFGVACPVFCKLLVIFEWVSDCCLMLIQQFFHS